MADLSVAIMAHPSRTDYVADLTARLDRKATVVYDTGVGIWHTARRAILAHDPAATHHLVLQDDAVVSRQLAAAVERVIAATPADTPVNLYLGRKKPNEIRYEWITQVATENGAVMIDMPGPMWGVACVYPVAHIPGLVEWCDAYTEADDADDVRISSYYRRPGMPHWRFTWPSLVNHRAGPSLSGSMTPGRVAWSFIGEDHSGLDIDWTGHVQHTDEASLHPPVRFVNAAGRIRTVGRGTRQWRRMVRDGRYHSTA